MTGLARAATAALAVLVPTTGLAAAVPSEAAARVAPSQRLAVIEQDHLARVAPAARARPLESVAARRPLTGVRTVLPVIGTRRSPTGRRWLHVRLPGRPSGHTGWIRAAGTRRSATEWRLAVDLSARRVTVRRDGLVARRFRAVIGAPSTPTPRGRFFIEEAVATPAGHPGGPFALATSARSSVLQEFAGGPGQIALHGTDGLAGAPGTAASHGCIRLDTRAITWLAGRIGGGVPLTVTR